MGAVIKRQGTSKVCRAQTVLRATRTSTRGAKWIMSDKNSSEQESTFAHTFGNFRATIKCCEQTHKIFKCGKLKKISVRERAELIKDRKLCFNCLRPGHRSEDCD